MPRNPKPNGKEASFDRHARAIQGDIARLTKAMESGFGSLRGEIDSILGEMAPGFAEIRSEMATKAEMAATHKGVLDLRDDVRRLNAIMVSKAELSERIGREFDVRPYAKESEVKDLQERMSRIEGTLNLKPRHRAA